MAKQDKTTQASKQGKQGKAAKGAVTDPAKMSWRRQLVETYKISRKADPAITWWMLGAFVVAGAIGFGLFYLLPPKGGPVDYVVSGFGALLFGLLATMVVFSRRAQKAAFASMEGQLGAGARALTLLKRGWKTDDVVAFTKQQDMVHRVVGPPGIVLVAEGNPNRLRPLLTSERRKHERVTPDTPVHEVIVGNDEGQVPLPKLVRHIQKLGRNVQPAEITEILARLRALDAQRPKVPMPHGPVPSNMRGMRQNLRGR